MTIVKALRGGSWGNSPRLCRSAFRVHGVPDLTFNSYGFRVVCNEELPLALQIRGGSWFLDPRACRSSFRDSYLPVVRDSDLGFRVVCTTSQPTRHDST